MYKIIDESGTTYDLYEYDGEAEFESMIIDNSEAIFGGDGIYFAMKKLIGKPKKGAAIPDGYYLDLTFHNVPVYNLWKLNFKVTMFTDISVNRFFVLVFLQKQINIK